MELSKNIFTRKNIWRLLAWVAAAGALIQVLVARQAEVMRWPQLSQEMGPADSDIWLRLTQVRQFLSGGDFFDHTVQNTNAPLGGVSIHWTRPMDFLLSLFYEFMPASLGLDKGLLLAAAWLPPVLGIVCFGVLVAAVRRCFDNVHAIWCLLFLLALSPLTDYFPPGECDHHGLLALLWCGVLCLLVRPLSRKGALLAGELLGLMIWISTEGVMLYALTCAVLGVIALMKPQEMKTFFFVTLGAAAVAMAGVFVEMPLNEILAVQKYDTLSIVYVALLTFVSCGVLVLSCPAVERMALKGRTACAGVAAAAVLALEIALFPEIIHGPLADVDPFITRVFFPRVMEAKTLFSHEWVFTLQHIWQPVLAVFLLMATAGANLNSLRKKRVMILMALLLGAFAMTLVQGRWTYYLQPVALVTIAGILPSWSVAARGRFMGWLKRMGRLYRPYATLALAAGIMLAAGAPFDFTPDQDLWNCQAQMRFVLQTQELQKLVGDEPRILYVPPEVAGDVLFFTPYRIIAGEYHREGRGLSDLEDIQNAKDADSARKLLAARKVDSLLACPASEKKESWLHALSPKTHPAWLQPVAGLKFMRIAGPRPVLFKIN